MITRDSFNEILDIDNTEITYTVYHSFFIQKFGDYSVQDHLLPINAVFPNPGIAREKAYIQKMCQMFLSQPNGDVMVKEIDNAIASVQRFQDRIRDVQKKQLDIQEDLKNQWNDTVSVLSRKLT